MAPARSARRTEVLGCPVDVLDMDEAVAAIVAMVETARAVDGGSERARVPGSLVVTLNPEMIVRAQTDEAFRRLVNRAALVIPDGIGVVRAARRRGLANAERVAGADLLDAYMGRAAELGHRVALVGAAPGIAVAAADEYRRRHPALQIVYAGGDDPTLRTVETLRAARPDFVGAAYGHGRQERFLADHLDDIGAAVGIGIGGTLDYVAGAVRRAPAVVRRANLEWAWRLARQPSRARRQAVLPLFWLRERHEARG